MLHPIATTVRDVTSSSGVVDSFETSAHVCACGPCTLGDGSGLVRRRPPYVYLAGGVLLLAEPKGTAGPLGFLDCLGFFFSLLLRS